MNTKTLSRIALLALPLAFFGCKAKAPESRGSKPVLIGEIRVPYAGPDAALVATVTDAADGHSGSNPPQTVEVRSTSNLVLNLADATCTGNDSISAPVVVQNYFPEMLTSVFVEFTDITPVDNAICTAKPDTAGFPGITSDWVISYGDLTGSSASNGSAPGGSASRNWVFDYSTGTPFAFRARVWANITPEPPSGGTSTAIAYCQVATGCGVPGSPGSALGTVPATLTWTGSTATGYVEVATDANFATTVYAAIVVAASGSGPYGFSHQITGDTTPGQRWWRAYNMIGGTVRGSFYTGGTYYIDGTPQQPTTYQYRVYNETGTPPCPMVLADFNTKPVIARHGDSGSVTTVHEGDVIVAYTETVAPSFEFFTFGWVESWSGYGPHPRENPFYVNLYACAPGSFDLADMYDRPRFAAATAVSKVNLIDPVEVGSVYVYGVQFCNQYDLERDQWHPENKVPTRGACSTPSVYNASDWALPSAPYPNWIPSAMTSYEYTDMPTWTVPQGTTVNINAGSGWEDPLYANVSFRCEVDNGTATLTSAPCELPIALASGHTTIISAISEGGASMGPALAAGTARFIVP